MWMFLAITAHRSVQREKVESYVRNVSVTDIDSPYRAALSDLADLDWQYSETGMHTLPNWRQVSCQNAVCV